MRIWGNDYIENDFMSPTTEEIRTARPLVTVLPEDVLSHTTFIAAALWAGAEGDDVGSYGSTSRIARKQPLP